MDKKSFYDTIGEDWWAVIIGLVLILASALGWLGESGLKIGF